MKSIIRVVSVVSGVVLSSALAADKRETQLAEIAALKAELKPLREKAYLEPDVIAARKKLDAAYREYWHAVRGAMLRLDPAKRPLVEKDIALRKKIGPVAGSRAEDYEKKAAAAKEDVAKPAKAKD